jgi:hypothetical protein
LIIHQQRRKENDRYICLQKKLDEHGQGKWEGKPKGKSDKRITEENDRRKKRKQSHY